MTKNENGTVAISDSWNLLTADCRYEGVKFMPSMKIDTGANKIKDIIVIIEKRVMLSNESCWERTAGQMPISNRKKQKKILK